MDLPILSKAMANGPCSSGDSAVTKDDSNHTSMSSRRRQPSKADWEDTLKAIIEEQHRAQYPIRVIARKLHVEGWQVTYVHLNEGVVNVRIISHLF